MVSDDLPITLSCEPGVGLLDSCGFEAHRNGCDWAARLNVYEVVQREGRLDISCRDQGCGLEVGYAIQMHPQTGMVVVRTELCNIDSDELAVDWMATVCLPVPAQFSHILTLTGRWANEFHLNRSPLPPQAWLSENRRGRTSHNRFPGIVLCEPDTNETKGDCLGVHLGWSGNHRVRVDQVEDGRAVLQLGALLLSGELSLASGEVYETPAAYLQYSGDGLGAMSAGFHDFYRLKLADRRVETKPRPVHYNTWEAVYFNHDEEKLMALADAAADTGIERFVLDDGWFLGRRSDHAGLGDWTVDPNVYPNGLAPLIRRVRNLGMEFGLWVEPEMVNEDSDLFRAHPEWVLTVPDVPEIGFRNQRVLDLTFEDAFNYVFDAINILLSENDISYLKWDMNRDLNLPGGRSGRPVAAAQMRAVYRLMDKIRRCHPGVEIESCASGGGRADFGVLGRSDRIWTSDSNDAIDRQRIQRGASMFFPLSILGAHVGPELCHTTGRRLPMHMRAATALMGHMGVEADLLKMPIADRKELTQAVSLYKRLRSTLHDGDFVRLDGPPHESSIGVVATDKALAIFSHAKLESEPALMPGSLKFKALDPKLTYLVRVVWPIHCVSPPPHGLEKTELLGDGIRASGELLMQIGLQLPHLFPGTCLILELVAEVP
ncbi:UNVERIFIED_CONTAM: hypothetical protein GTU68_066614 [Idotea baltica]|nr:hypothetical protein [Idotea baltica]